MPEENSKTGVESYPGIIKSLRSPLSVFGLAMLVCNAVFSVSAAIMTNLDAFIYSIHTFLAIVFAFIAIAIWSPRSLYHPAELENLEKQIPEEKNSRAILTSVILLTGMIYAGYQVYKVENEQCEKDKIESPGQFGNMDTSNIHLQST